MFSFKFKPFRLKCPQVLDYCRLLTRLKVDFLGASDGASSCIFLQHFEENIRVFKKNHDDLLSSLTVSD